MIIDVAKIAKEVKVKLPDLITRPVGRMMYAATVKKLSIIGAGETVILDFSGVKVIDSSFIDEYIVKLILDSREKDFYLKLRNISPISEINIDSVFNSYSNYKDTRIAVAREEIGKNNRFYIGPLGEHERDIMDYLRINLNAGIEDISRFSGIDFNILKTLLDELSILRVIRRNNGDFTSV
ncbi:MAG TPA: STAS-like domain-containing protein [Spirochaetota bacterium]|nr:STAS-like domain-containing protein [Spirochaetota bacterium]HPS85474.1 STAS-like domain-containing protein [Spirochaetota bacterium]